MADVFYDRFNGRPCPCVAPQQTLVGRWQVIPESGTAMFMNSVAVTAREFLVPEPSGNWRLLGITGVVAEGSVARGLQPEAVEADSLRSIGAALGAMPPDARNWLHWLDVVPLVPGISEVADVLPLERMVREGFGHLEAVCMKPRAHLHVEVERVPVDMARRLPVKAASYLASHTEDWERPQIRGVLPKRILSEVRQDQIDIYENRVAARLIDHVLVYLAQRIQVLQKLLKVFQDKEDYSRAVGGTYLRQHRILNLWGQSIDSNEGRLRAAATLRELEALKYRVMGLMGSPLYREVPRRTYVAPTLRTTNILANDQNYRRVADLWRAWASLGYAKIKSPSDVHREAQELCSGMDRFAMLLVTRALEQLGYLPSDEDLDRPVLAPARWVLTGHGTRLQVVWDEDCRVRVEVAGRRLTFVALPMDLGSASGDAQFEDIALQVVEAVSASDDPSIILYSRPPDAGRGAVSEAGMRRLHSVGNDPRARVVDGCGLLPVSPWDIGSVERVARSLRWFLDSARFDAYPPVVPVGAQLRDEVASLVRPGWLEAAHGGRQVVMRRAPKDFEWERLGIDQVVAAAGRRHQEAVAEHERLSDELREAVRKDKTGTLNQQKKSAHQRRVECEERLVGLRQLAADVAIARARSDALLVCPACGTLADATQDFEARDKNCFRCDCQECRTQWGTRLCGNGHRYPVMLPGDFVDTTDSRPGWEDRMYGSDLLAVPARAPDGGWGFVCPTCGDIG